MRRLLSLLLVLLLASRASADAISDARARYRTAEALKAEHRYDEAIVAYQDAYALAASPEIFFNVALCYKLKGDRPHALEVLRTYLEMNPSGAGAPRARELVAVLEREVAAERPPTPPPVPAPPRATPAPALAPAAAPALAPAAAPAPAPARGGGRGLRVAGIVALAAGGLALVAGAAMQLRASSIRGDLADLDAWDPDLYASGRAAQRNATLLLGAGAAVAATGGVLLILGVRAAASVERDRAMVTVAGTF